ncbi:MAG: GreA/GreB family elongation factor [Firmicutes bacterium]|nr:GreA/GreB family elongation factor [Bacillota bacterium]MCL2770773.1 GreA/GreB family elongation factor [Bacillota bacterium]
MTVYLSQEGFNLQQEKLKEMKGPIREDLSKKLGTAREHGDLSENSEYQEARESINNLDKDIAELEALLRTAKVYKKATDGTIGYGSIFTILDIEENEKMTYEVRGILEANGETIISNESPIGAAIWGKRKGEDAFVATANGKYQVKILDVK